MLEISTIKRRPGAMSAEIVKPAAEEEHLVAHRVVAYRSARDGRRGMRRPQIRPPPARSPPAADLISGQLDPLIGRQLSSGKQTGPQQRTPCPRFPGEDEEDET
jgi:hypothetical protein